MVLAKNEGNNLKVDSYMDTICRLKAMLMKKMGQVHEKDHKDDLQILYNDTCILWRAADKLLCKSEGMSNTSNMSNMGNMGKMHNMSEMKHTMKSNKQMKHHNKKSKKSNHSIKKSLSNMMGGFFKI
jgi:hypothetical protein